MTLGRLGGGCRLHRMMGYEPEACATERSSGPSLTLPARDGILFHPSSRRCRPVKVTNTSSRLAWRVVNSASL